LCYYQACLLGPNQRPNGAALATVPGQGHFFLEGFMEIKKGRSVIENPAGEKVTVGPSERAVLAYLKEEGRMFTSLEIGRALYEKTSSCVGLALASRRVVMQSWAGKILTKLRKKGLVKSEPSGRGLGWGIL